jgi:hypothetical protein
MGTSLGTFWSKRSTWTLWSFRAVDFAVAAVVVAHTLASPVIATISIRIARRHRVAYLSTVSSKHTERTNGALSVGAVDFAKRARVSTDTSA